MKKILVISAMAAVMDWISLQSDSRGELVVIQKLHQSI